MWFCLSFLLIFQSFKCEEIPTFKNETELKNKTVELQRITQPTQQIERSQSQQIERALTTPSASASTNSSLPEKGKSSFRPSPQLETYLEFNKFPVPPALPEAKHFSAFNFGETPIQWPNTGYTTQQAWTSRIKFPTTTSVPTSKERPYPFYNNDDGSTGKSYSVPMKSDTFFNTPLHNLPTVNEWNQFLNEKKQQVIQKNQFDFSAPVERPSYDVGQKNNYDFGAIEKPPTHGVQGSPWKKIIKFLTAAIPIGLLISALTPTVITVQSVNGTQFRSRAADSDSRSPNSKLVSSLNYFNSVGCEDRILCELVLSASSTQNGEHHVENLLNTFTQEGKAVEKAEEMRQILEAVKKQDCRSIICKNMKEKT